jgi:hypothetical protein
MFCYACNTGNMMKILDLAPETLINNVALNKYNRVSVSKIKILPTVINDIINLWSTDETIEDSFNEIISPMSNRLMPFLGIYTISTIVRLPTLKKIYSKLNTISVLLSENSVFSRIIQPGTYEHFS